MPNCLKQLSFVFLVIIGIFTCQGASAATSYFSPSSGTFVGENISVDVLIDTKGIAINNVEAVVRYPNNLLEIVSTSASDSIFSLWVGAPKYSNETGTLSFTAGMPTPGFTGDAGKVLSIVFKVKGSGAATLTFSSAIIRANDGYGSNVFQSGSRAIFDLAPEIKSTVTATPVAEVLAPPVFTGYPTELQVGEQLTVYGTARPESQVNIWFQQNQGDQKNVAVKSDSDGRFTFSVEEKTKEGVYRLWADVSDGHGTRSVTSEKIAVVVVRPSIARSFVALAITLLILVFGAWYAWRSYSLSKKRLRKETLEAESSLHKMFGSLRENRERLEMFETARTKRTLTDEEEKIVAWLKQDLDNAEMTVEKEIVDIEEEVK